MDGLNGMAGGNAVITAFFLCIVSFSQASNFTYIVCYTMIPFSPLSGAFWQKKMYSRPTGAIYINC